MRQALKPAENPDMAHPTCLQSWERAADQFAKAQGDLIRGEAAAIKRLWATTDDVTIFGGFGGCERGWSEVGPRLDWIASQFADGKLVNREYLASQTHAHLGYTVHIDRFLTKVGQDRRECLVELRVTQVWRREGDEWRIIHRHGDSLTRKIEQP
jgi:hypothetical protein